MLNRRRIDADLPDEIEIEGRQLRELGEKRVDPIRRRQSDLMRERNVDADPDELVVGERSELVLDGGERLRGAGGDGEEIGGWF